MKIESKDKGWEFRLSTREYWLIRGSFNEVLNGFVVANFSTTIGENESYVTDLFQIVKGQFNHSHGQETDFQGAQMVTVPQTKDLKIIFNVFQENWNYFTEFEDEEMLCRLQCTWPEYRRLMDELAAALEKQKG